jgi:hypothetical protein
LKTDRSVVKFDALIMACARRFGADCVISLDDDMFKLAGKAGVTCREPGYFRGDPPAQQRLRTTKGPL